MIYVISSMVDVIPFMLDGCNMYVIVSFTLWHLYHGLDKDEVFYFDKCILALRVYYSFMWLWLMFRFSRG